MKAETIVTIDFKRDLGEISTFIQEYIDTTYLTQIHDQISTYKRQCETKPCQEAQLLKAIMPFVEEENKGQFSSLIQMITYSQMIQVMLPSYKAHPLFMGGDGEDKINNFSSYIHQAILALFLYQAILWAEQYK